MLKSFLLLAPEDQQVFSDNENPLKTPANKYKPGLTPQSNSVLLDVHVSCQCINTQPNSCIAV